MLRTFYEEHKGAFQTVEGLLLKNTVLEKGLVIAPVVVVSSSVKNGVALSIAFGIITFFTVMLSSYIPKKIPHTLRVILAVLFAGVMYIPTTALLNLWFPGTVYQLGIFLPLMATNSLIVWRSESRFHKETRPRMALDLFFHILGFFAVIVIVGAIREIWGNGTFWGDPVPFVSTPVAGILLPFSGFILLGFFSAVLHKFKNAVIPLEEEKLSEKCDGTLSFGYQTMPSAGKAQSRPEEVPNHE